jgi:hypothetical protein
LFFKSKSRENKSCISAEKNVFLLVELRNSSHQQIVTIKKQDQSDGRRVDTKQGIFLA